MKILVLNSGSSSQKACLYDLAGQLPDAAPRPLWEGKIEWRGDGAKLEVRTASGVKAEQELKRGERADATTQLLEALLTGETRVLTQLSEMDVVGHRIVNGGRKFTRPTVVTGEVKAAIAEKWVRALAIRAQEDWAIARECWKLRAQSVPQPNSIIHK